MKKFLKNYGLTVAILAGIALGAVCGVCWPSEAAAVKPVGDIFMNLLFTLVVPLVFFSISASICNLKRSGTAGRTIGIMFLVFLGMSIVAGAIGYIGTKWVNPFGGLDRSMFGLQISDTAVPAAAPESAAIVRALTVSNFLDLFSKSNLLPLIVFSMLLGLATAACKAERVAAFLQEGNNVIMKIMNIVMYAAPVGLGCYFAHTISSLGSQLLSGYLKAFVLYLAFTALFFFIVNSGYILIFGGPQWLRKFWQFILPPSFTALATASSAVAIPGNIDASIKMGVKPEIAQASVPLGTSIHKDGCIISGIIKVMMLMALLGMNMNGVGAALGIWGIAFLSGVVMGAIPSGAVTGEILICSLLGCDPALAGIIIVFSTLVDIPSTVVNSSANVVSAVITDRLSVSRSVPSPES